ncbi:MAG: Gfo/Idh/MocA family oxidoreductase, partial [Planctomycetota bacterium]|nr:Gfo/Idh/MocA family oxidoreductase [Planctomycetota bacterium]
MAKTIKVGIIGTGGIAQNQHMPGYQKCKDVEIVAVCDVNEAVAKAAAEKFKVPKVFSDYRDLVAMSDIDAVSVCTPNKFHAAPTIAALRAGKHVMVEKPIAM